ncbi:MAG: SH3 domain-containing protein [Streptococcus orisratti]|nr:SH3 domain-containing protein [Streptococcus orisratti]
MLCAFRNAIYDAGNTVNYDKVLLSDGHYWISYIATSGNRRYISIT